MTRLRDAGIGLLLGAVFVLLENVVLAYGIGSLGVGSLVLMLLGVAAALGLRRDRPFEGAFWTLLAGEAFLFLVGDPRHPFQLGGITFSTQWLGLKALLGLLALVGVPAAIAAAGGLLAVGVREAKLRLAARRAPA